MCTICWSGQALCYRGATPSPAFQKRGGGNRSLPSGSYVYAFQSENWSVMGLSDAFASSSAFTGQTYCSIFFTAWRLAFRTCGSTPGAISSTWRDRSFHWRPTWRWSEFWRFLSTPVLLTLQTGKRQYLFFASPRFVYSVSWCHCFEDLTKHAIRRFSSSH